MGNVNANPVPAKLNHARSGWLYDYSQVNNKPDCAQLSSTQMSWELLPS